MKRGRSGHDNNGHFKLFFYFYFSSFFFDFIPRHAAVLKVHRYITKMGLRLLTIDKTSCHLMHNQGSRNGAIIFSIPFHTFDSGHPRKRGYFSAGVAASLCSLTTTGQMYCVNYENVATESHKDPQLREGALYVRSDINRRSSTVGH